jgi:hypothetical protein
MISSSISPSVERIANSERYGGKALTLTRTSLESALPFGGIACCLKNRDHYEKLTFDREVNRVWFWTRIYS